ncbi:MAG: periplasmic heavy metal sensor [Pseudomonadota bacterium]
MKRYLMLLLAVILLVPAGTAFAGPWGRGMGMGPGYGPGYYATANLTTDQAAKLQTLRESFLKEIGPLQNTLFAKRSEMQRLWTSTQPETEKIAVLQKDLSDLRGKVQESRLQYNLECRKVLSP